MMKFKPEDFKKITCRDLQTREELRDFELSHLVQQAIADIANAKLEQWLKDAPKAWGRLQPNGEIIFDGDCTSSPYPGYKAKLVCIETIKEEK